MDCTRVKCRHLLSMAGRRSKPIKTDDQIRNVGADNDYADQMHAALKTQETLFMEIIAMQEKTFMPCLEAYTSVTNSRVNRFLTKITHDVTELKTSLLFTSDHKSSMAELARKPSAEDVQPVMTRTKRHRSRPAITRQPNRLPRQLL